MSETHTENGAGPGHNSGEITSDVKMALGFEFKRQYEKALKAKKEADAGLKNTAKRALANGISVDDIKTMIRLDSPEGEAAIRAEIERTIEMSRWMGAEIGTQLDLLDMPDRRPLNEKVRAEGKLAGMKGETCIATVDGDTGQEWVAGWHEGQAALMAALDLTKAGVAEIAGQDGATVISGEEATKRRRGRPRKNPEPEGPAVAGEGDPFAPAGTPLN